MAGYACITVRCCLAVILDSEMSQIICNYSSLLQYHADQYNMTVYDTVSYICLILLL